MCSPGRIEGRTRRGRFGYKPGSTWTTDPLFMKVGTEYYFYHNDHLGTPQKMTAVNGAVVWSAKYSSFGKAEVDAGATVVNNLRFPGQYFDSESGLHYNFFRYYDPKDGRYQTADLIGFDSGEINFYAYAFNNSVNWIDYFGLEAVEPLPPNPKPSPSRPIFRSLPGGGESVKPNRIPLILRPTPIVIFFAIMAPEPAGEGSDIVPAPRIAPWERRWRTHRERWLVYVRCNVKEMEDCKGCPARMGGKGYGKTFSSAFSHAQMDANANLGYQGFRLCHARHCQPIRCFVNGQKVPCPKSGR